MITAMIADCGVSVPRVKPSALRPGMEPLANSPRDGRACCRACISLRIEVAAVATTLGGSEAVNT